MTHLNKTSLAVFISAALFAGSSAYAASTAQPNPEDQLTVTVTDKQDDDLSSKQTIDQEAIKNTPSGNGNLSDYLKSNPNVRYAESDQSGFTNGEIKPASISINGADPSQTAYMLDGININNDIDPTGGLFEGHIGVIPSQSSEQAYFFDANMLAGVTVYDSNVPANLGGFTGGAVVAETRQYSGKSHTQLKYRGTRSSWASMKVDDNIKNDLDAAIPLSNGAIYQPIYKKEFFSLVTEQGITDNIGMVLGFSRRDSNIRQSRQINPAGDRDNQDHTRRSDNILANFNWTPDVNRSLELGLRYSDYKEGKYFADNIDGNVTDTHQAYGTTLRWKQYLAKGTLTATAAYDKFADQRESNSSHAIQTFDIGNDRNYESGGYGDSQIAQQNTNFMLDYALDPLTWGKTTHAIKLGASHQITNYDFNRDQNVIVDQRTLFAGMEFGDTKTVSQGNVSTKYQNSTAYAQDIIKWNNLTLRPGVRIEKDDYLGNTNIAPRFSANWQALANTRLNLGLNRYYGRSFASMKLAGEILKLDENHSRRYESIDGLNTPYADELSLGINQNVGNFALTARYVLRKNKQRLVPDEKGSGNNIVEEYRNGSDFNVNIYTLQVSNVTPWVVGPTHWNTTLGADWIDTDRSDLQKNINPDELIFLDGKMMTRRQAEQTVNSSEEEWMVRLGLDMQLPKYNITWANKVYVKAPITGYEYDTDTSIGISKFNSFDFGTHTQWDTRVRWQPHLIATHNMYVQVDVLNVLNQVRQKTARASRQGDYGEYTPGREFWLELGYEF
ncbi:TonB-dependent receptor plug domain-containing protein [Vibrio tapetis]|uniref:TonB-dependent receptor plug domain-containing protein n=1 Tax=Vibrio tapetis subsp. tapetis TaxID=1671868 RepID=A0A2N8ZAN1_9VIBR|nr:TonB-dependent receptor plug domain-containing protein [Vibrio tapetis]SON48961.1 conserved exported protein of unknown function [Vibrio tapetis subsp. tapetis]